MPGGNDRGTAGEESLWLRDLLTDRPVEVYLPNSRTSQAETVDTERHVLAYLCVRKRSKIAGGF